METARTTQERVRRAMTAVLPQGLNAEIIPVPDSTPARFELTVKAGSVHHRFLSGWAGGGWPGDVDKLLVSAPKLDVVFARRFSEGARAKLADRRTGWVDESRFGPRRIDQL